MTNITRWDPFREFWGVRPMLGRFYNPARTPSETAWLSTALNIALDVAETDEEYIVKASLPGINPDDLEVTYDSNVLTIKGEIQKDEELEEGRYHMRERRYGSFSRSISLPYSVKADGIEASYQSGILKLTLPKSEDAKPKKIKVNSAAETNMIEGKASSSNK
jgi:HSP20 family protein